VCFFIESLKVRALKMRASATPISTTVHFVIKTVTFSAIKEPFLTPAKKTKYP
jgi:hypothetical protein